jgi:aerobic carbon-monoxide dehydrogenase medium subunit
VLAHYAGADLGGDRGSDEPERSVKPVRFDYRRPADVASAIALAQRDDLTVKFIAGGQSLGPMLNLRLVQPDLLIDLTGIGELKQVVETPEALILGACITHADVEDGRVPDVARGALRSLAAGIAYRAVRNRGTIGGSVSHADPAADWIAGLVALGASVIIRGQGRRSAAIEEFVTGVFENTLAPGELVEAVRVPRLSERARWGFYKVSRKAGDFAHAIGAVLDDPGRGICRAVIGATGSKPIVWASPGNWPDANRADGFDREVVRDALTANGVRDPVRQQIHVAALRRAFAQAFAS